LNIPKQLFRNTIVGWSEMILRIGTVIVITPLLLSRLGREGYGVWLLVGQVIIYLSIVDLGVASSISRFVAKYNAKHDHKGVSRVVNSAIFLFLLSSIAIVVCTLAIWPYFASFFDLSEEYQDTAGWLVLLTGLGLAATFPLRIGAGMLRGIHRPDLVYFLRAAGSVLKLVLIGIFFGWLRYESLILLAVINIAVTTVPSLLMCRSAYKRFAGTVKLRRQYISLPNLKEIWSLSLSAVVVTLAALLLKQGQVMCVGKIINAKTVVLYGIPVSLLVFGIRCISYVVAAFRPLASHMHALNESKRLKKLNIEGTKIAFTISLFIAVMATAFGYPLFRIWLPSQILSTQDFMVMANVLAIMAIGFAIGVPQNVTSIMLSGTDKHWFVAVVSLIASVIGLLVGVLLMASTNLGLYGMALGWASVFFIKGILIFPMSICRSLKIRLFSYIRQVYLPPLASIAILIIVVYFVRYFFEVTSLLTLLCSMALCMAVYAIAVYLICFDKKQRVAVWDLITMRKAQ
jgi:O-antigen/teichoic acid export membrane protein